MKKFLYIGLSVLLCVGAVGGGFTLAKQFNAKPSEDNIINAPADCVTRYWEEQLNGGKETSEVWRLCDDVSKLSAGDQIVIAVQSKALAMSTTQNTSNRAPVTIVKNEDAITFGDNVQIIVLESGIVENTFAFNVGTGYLYAPSSASNQLKTHIAIDENSSWSISIGENNVATIAAQGDSTRNVLMYNPTSMLFSCYASATTQDPLVIYKLENSGGN